MKITKKKILLTISLQLLLIFGLFAIDKVVVASEEWEDCTNADGTGLYWEILQKIYEPAGVKVEIQIVPYNRAVVNTQQKKVDMFVGAYYNEAEGVLFPPEDYFFDADRVMVVMKEDADFQGQASLQGQVVGWIRGYAYDEYLDVEVEKYPLSQRDSGFKMIKADRLNYMLDAEAEIDNYSEEQLSGLKIEHLLNLNLYYVFADNENGRELLEIYKKGFDKLRESGELRKMFEKWDFVYLW